MVLRASGPPEPNPVVGPDTDNVLAHYRTARAQESLFEPRGGSGTGYDEFVDGAATSGRRGRNWPNAWASVAGAA